MNNDYILYPLLLLVVAIAILAGAFNPKVKQAPLTAQYIPTTPSNNSPENTQQFKNVNFIKITFTPTPAPIDLSLLDQTSVAGQPTKCSGNVVSFGIAKKLLPIGTCSDKPPSGRPGSCTVPHFIVVHTTHGPGTTALEEYNFFASGGNVCSAVQYIIGKAGDALQMTETLDKTVEVAYGTGSYYDAINIELSDFGDYKSRYDIPKAQYATLKALLIKLMAQYNIPVGPKPSTFISPDNARHNYPPGIYGHYQLSHWPISNKTDPGQGFFHDLRQDLGATNP